jgi:tetratricopeptide (TPR) repeat protein
MKRTRLIVAAAILTTILAWTALAAPRQEIDPFYLQSMKTGETLFQSRNFREAASSLEIAAFGLFSRKDLLGRVRLLLGLCHGYLNDSAKSESSLRAAYALLGPTGLAEANLPEAAKADLSALLRRFKMDVVPSTFTEPVKPPAPTEKTITPKVDPVPAAGSETEAKLPLDLKALQAEILRAPREAEAYYALAKAQELSGDLPAARQTYQKLLTNNPAEVRAYLESGKVSYRQRSLKECERMIEKYLDLSRGMRLDRLLTAEAKAYLALSAFLRGDTAKAQKTIRDAPEFFDADLFDSLRLGPEDSARLIQLLGRLGKK